MIPKNNKCIDCIHSERVIGSGHHISCNNPDYNMEGNLHGIANGWFNYPFNFDPIWRTKECDNYTSIKGE